MASSPCVNPKAALRKDGTLKPGFKDSKIRKGKRCIKRAKGASAVSKKRRRKIGKKRTGRKVSARKPTGSRPCPRGSFRVKRGKNKGRCRKLTGAAAAAAAGRPMGFMRKRGRARVSGGADFMNWD
jgi:hypothetical protein